jgi:hypothetical protein
MDFLNLDDFHSQQRSGQNPRLIVAGPGQFSHEKKKTPYKEAVINSVEERN